MSSLSDARAIITVTFYASLIIYALHGVWRVLVPTRKEINDRKEINEKREISEENERYLRDLNGKKGNDNVADGDEKIETSDEILHEEKKGRDGGDPNRLEEKDKRNENNFITDCNNINESDQYWEDLLGNLVLNDDFEEYSDENNDDSSSDESWVYAADSGVLAFVWLIVPFIPASGKTAVQGMPSLTVNYDQ